MNKKLETLYMAKNDCMKKIKELQKERRKKKCH